MTVGNEPGNLMKRLATYLPDPVYQELEQWANTEKRSLSNLVAFLLEKSVIERRKESKETQEQEEQS
jgi:hypothetical protein